MSQPYTKTNSHSSNVLTPRKTHPNKARSSRKSWLVRRLRLIYLKFIRLRGNPQAIATGLAAGVFAGFFPFLGFQTILGIILAAIFRGSKVAAVAATWISNPLTYVPLFIFNYKIGKFLLGVEKKLVIPADLSSLADFKEMGFTLVITLLTGCLAAGAVASIVTYFYSLTILEKLRARKSRRKSKIELPR